MFLQSLVKLNDSVSVRNFAPNSREAKKKKKGLRHMLVLYQSRNFEFLVAKWVLLAKKPRGPDIFCPL